MPEVIFNGPDGRLEGRYQQGTAENAPIALILHSNPKRGGSMNNKVTYTLFQSFVDLGFSVLRFNFRGVGRSQGVYDGGQGELGDAASALDWLQNMNRDARACWIAGYSFGAWIGLQLLMRRPEISGFVAVSPPANTKDFSFLAPCPSSGLIIHGDADERVPEAPVAALAEKLGAQRGAFIGYKPIAHANHAFDNHLKDVYVSVADYVEELNKRHQKKHARKKQTAVGERK